MKTSILSRSIGAWRAFDDVSITADATAPVLMKKWDGTCTPKAAEALEIPSPAIEDLVAGSVAGTPGALRRLLTEIQPIVLRYCRARLGRQETGIGSADDVAQEVCLAVVSALPNYTIKGLSFRAFVYGIAAHKVTDAFRTIGRNRSEPTADLPATPVLHDGPEQRLLASELAERLRHLVHRLTPRQREVLVLRIAVGLSAEETAEMVGSTPGAVCVTQHRALNRLRAELEPAADDDTFDVSSTVRADTQAHSVLATAYTDLVDDLGASVLDLTAGAEDATRVATYTDLTGSLAELLDLDAGLSAIIGRPVT